MTDLKLPTTEGGWGTIVADPGWPFSDMGSRATPDYLRQSPMTLEEIRNLPVQVIRAEQSHLYLWAVDAHLEFAFEVIPAWGYEFKHTIPWIKRRPAYLGGKPGELQFGMGHYYRKAHELCLFATAGGCKVLRHDQLSVIEAPRRAHSEKPERLQDLAEIMSPGPRLELFARRQREGWTCWGDQVGNEPADDEDEPDPPGIWLQGCTLSKKFPWGTGEVHLGQRGGRWFVSWPTSDGGWETADFSTISGAARHVFANTKGYPNKRAYRAGTGRLVPGVSWNFFGIKDRSQIAPDLVSLKDAVVQILEVGDVDPEAIDVGTSAFYEHFSADHAGVVQDRLVRELILGEYTLYKLMEATLKATEAKTWRDIAYEPTIKGRSPLDHFAALEGLERARLPDYVLDRHAREDYHVPLDSEEG